MKIIFQSASGKEIAVDCAEETPLMFLPSLAFLKDRVLDEHFKLSLREKFELETGA